MWEREREVIQMRNDLKNERNQFKKPLFKPTTTKLIVAFIFINCTVVEIYSMWVMYKLADISALYSLISAVVGEAFTFAIYAAKSTKENTVGGIIYDKALSVDPDPISADEDNPGQG